MERGRSTEMTFKTKKRIVPRMSGGINLAFLLGVFITAGLLNFGVTSTAWAAATYQSGYISNVTLAGEDAFIMLNSGLPDNCAGTGSGWMRVSGLNKPMVAFVL